VSSQSGSNITEPMFNTWIKISLIRVMQPFLKSSRGRLGSAILSTEPQRASRPDSITEVPAPSTMLGGPAALREPQRTATNDTLRGD